MSRGRNESRPRQVAWALLLLSTTIGVWCWVYGRTSLDAWKIPICYQGDCLFYLAYAKAFADGEILPLLPKYVEQLNSPFTANWNDFPVFQDATLAAMGWLSRLTGLFAAANFMVLLAHILAALSFWWVGLRLKYSPPLVFAAALLFAFPEYIFFRNLAHINLSFYWHVPLTLLVSWWALSRDRLLSDRSSWHISLVVCFVAGTLNPYYSAIFLHFLVFAVLLHSSRRQWEAAKLPLLLGCVVVLGALAVNADTLLTRIVAGSNERAILRTLAHLEAFGLKITELFVPPPDHRWQALGAFAQRNYYAPSYIKGNLGSVYLGVIGMMGFLWLMGSSLYRLLQGKLRAIPVQAFQVLWIVLYATIGGINALLGVFGFVLLRGTNCHSIIILCISLLFLTRQLTRRCPRRLVYPAALALLAVGLFDQLPEPTSANYIASVGRAVASDRALVEQLESAVPIGTRVFQLPVMDHPEAPSIYNSIYKMRPYAHLRPYLFSTHLRFSHGSHKGRPREQWQREVAELSTAGMAAALERYGFGALYVNRNGYPQRAAGLLDELAASGRPILAESRQGDIMVVELSPSATPVLPEHRPALPNRRRTRQPPVGP